MLDTDEKFTAIYNNADDRVPKYQAQLRLNQFVLLYKNAEFASINNSHAKESPRTETVPI